MTPRLGVFLLSFSLWPSAGRADPIDAIVGESLAVWGVPGAAVVVVKDDRAIHLRGHGRLRHDRPDPVTPDSPFPLASCTKAFTTTLMAMLAGQRKLAWDDPVRKHLPGFRLADPPADARVTLRDLVTHRTGVGSHDLLWYRAPWDTGEMVRRVGELEPGYPFRDGFEYQSVMFTAAGLAAARAGGRSWERLVHERIFGPLGMRSAGCRTSEAPPGDRPWGHRPGPLEATPWYEIDEPNPAGSIHASARDLGAWLRFHLGRGEFDGRRLCPERALSETHEPRVVIPLKGLARRMNPETHLLCYAMGWVVQDYRGERMLSHGGAIDGFRAHLTLFPERGIGLAILSNLHGTRMNQALSNRLADHLLGLESKDWDVLFRSIEADELRARADRIDSILSRRVDDTRPRRPTADYAGRYRDPAYGEAVVSVRDGGLFWHWSGFACPLEHFHYDTFRPADEFLFGQLGELIEFRFDADGVVGGLSAFGRTFRRVPGE